MLDKGVTGPWVKPSQVHPLPSVQGGCENCESPYPTPARWGRRGSLELLPRQMGWSATQK